MLDRAMFAVAAICVAMGVAGSAVAAATPTPGGTLFVLLDGPPGSPDAMTVVVSVAGADITDRCTDEVPPEDGRRTIACSDLEDGIYSVELLDAADGSVVESACSDVVAEPGELGDLQIGNGFTDWVCFVTVGPPSVLLTAGPRDPFDPVVVDEAGVPVDCVDDATPFQQRRWCTTPFGAYRIESDSIDDAFRESVTCDSVPPPDVEFERVAFERIDVSVDDPFVTCQQDEVSGLSIDVGWIGLETESAPWFDGVGLRILDADGSVLDIICDESDQADGPGLRHVVFSCHPGIGTFDVDVLGVPDGLQLSVSQVGDFGVGACGLLTTGPSEQGICILRFETAASVERSNEPDEPDDMDTLPETGSYAGPLALVGLGLCGAGLAMVVGTRRRSFL